MKSTGMLEAGLTPGCLYKTTININLWRTVYKTSDIVCIPVGSILFFVREEDCSTTNNYDRYNLYYLYFLYEHRIVYESRYKIDTYMKFWEELM